MRASKEIFLAGVLLLFLLSCSPRGTGDVRAYIASSWDATVRFTPTDTNRLLGMPSPYTVPCIEGTFDELYYWDTYFTNEGLIADGRPELAIGNTEDLLYLAGRFGFVPNGNRDWYLSRSQPPYLARMVEQVFSQTQDTSWLEKAFPILEKEYCFWQEERIAPCGLNRYGYNVSRTPADLPEEFLTTAGRRLGADFRQMGWTDELLLKFGLDCIAECESGWDFNPRFDRRCGDFCPVDLNANLYGMEKRMAAFARTLGLDSDIWEERAGLRRQRMRTWMYDPGKEGWYDYDYVRDTRSDVVSAAVFSLLFNEVLPPEEAEAVRNTLTRLEYPCGLSVCERRDYPFPYQWSFPNAWPPTTFIAVMGLMNYGYAEDALRLARNYVGTVARLYRETGQLWEKTDARSGRLPVDREYGTPAMMGWTAGVFVCMDQLIKNNQ